MRTIATFASLLCFVVACGKAAPEAAAPQSPPAEAAAPSSLAGSAERDDPEHEPQTLAEAEALLDQARADLERLALNEPGSPAQATAGAAPAPAPAPVNRAEEKRADKTAADQAEAPAPKKETRTCETACKAFSSLERASVAVCRLDTDGGGKRCERARQIREDAARRISSCGCR